MNARVVLSAVCFLFFLLLAILASGRKPQPEVTPKPDSTESGWKIVARSAKQTVYRSQTAPAAYLIDIDGHGLLIDAPEGLPDPPVPVEGVLLTHHHRDTVAGLAPYLERKLPVRAAVESAEWLTAEKVAKFWADSIPLRNSRTAYFVVGSGFEGIGCILKDGDVLPWQGEKIRVISTPGHSRDHLAFALDSMIFCGDAVMGTGHLATPFTTDWDHWTDAGLKPTADSLRKLAANDPSALFPSRGEPVLSNISAFLDRTAKAVEEVGFLKSFERYTNRLGSPPKYEFLVPPEQVGSNGTKPWSRVSESIWITGNTYLVKSKQTNSCLVIDPWGENSVKQIEKLRADEKLGAIELVIFTHAHYDHFDGVYTLPGSEKYAIWALEQVAEPLRDPFKLRAPFLDARPIAFAKTFRDGDTASWHEFTFTFRHLPGQTWFTAGLETTIDGKRCYFTADNFFHATQYSGSGGWMGLNRSSPLMYASSAKKVLDAKPEWILAEHGGPYVFHDEDYARRSRWGLAAAKACDAISFTGKHRNDWNPHRVTVEPIKIQARPGDRVNFELHVGNYGDKPVSLAIAVSGAGILEQRMLVEAPAGRIATKALQLTVPANWKPGRHIVDVRPRNLMGEVCDPFLAIDVLPTSPP
jgi:glyoxylase-like metal-dependent hydrolase (beta-lactamase superfamily II)